MIRLNAFLSHAGILSRRSADLAIQRGEIMVNGEVRTEMGILINPETDRVTYQGDAVAALSSYVYLIFHKPKGYISSTKPEKNAPSVMELLPPKYQELRVYPVGRLDKDSEGLLLLTNDGKVADIFTHPRYGVEKEYLVSLDNAISKENLAKIRKGVRLVEGVAKPDRVTPLPGGKGMILSVIMHEGKKREIRRIFANVGYLVEKLIRVRMGTLQLGHLDIGKWKEIKKEYVMSPQKPQASPRSRARTSESTHTPHQQNPQD